MYPHSSLLLTSSQGRQRWCNSGNGCHGHSRLEQMVTVNFLALCELCHGCHLKWTNFNRFPKARPPPSMPTLIKGVIKPSLSLNNPLRRPYLLGGWLAGWALGVVGPLHSKWNPDHGGFVMPSILKSSTHLAWSQKSQPEKRCMMNMIIQIGKFTLEPEHHLFQKENHHPNLHFRVPC